MIETLWNHFIFNFSIFLFMKNFHQNKGWKYLKQVQFQIPYFGILLTFIYSSISLWANN
jgi:hypothetical protein